jgi:NAD(P)-dependent dehydrogenase (short-subunit alcohol dehydrogenase family)
MADWTESDVPEQTGQRALITGANSGLGWENARALAGAGAHVVMGCRNPQKAEDALERLLAIHPDASAEILLMDMADLASIRSAVELDGDAPLDLLINNAGIMGTDKAKTADGFESQLGTNHLGHFALTGLLLGRLDAAPAARVVTVSSFGHRPGKIDFDDLQSERGYNRWVAYFQSKLANLLFTYELQRRLEAAGSSTSALAAHPGGSNTELGKSRDGSGGFTARIIAWGEPITARLMQSAQMGALPTLRAAVDPSAKGGEYYGPDGFMEQKGHPVVVESTKRSHDQVVARRLWDVSEELTGVHYEFGAAS